MHVELYSLGILLATIWELTLFPGGKQTIVHLENLDVYGKSKVHPKNLEALLEPLEECISMTFILALIGRLPLISEDTHALLALQQGWVVLASSTSCTHARSCTLPPP